MMTREQTYWDKLAKTPEEKKLLARIRKNKLGQMCEHLYASAGCEGYWEEGDTFASEVLYRIGYEIGHWYQDLEWYMSDYEEGFRKSPYPDGITPASIHSAERWLSDAEKILKTGKQDYW